MKLKKFKETNPKRIGIILFTISCILLITGVMLYRTFAIFQVDTTQNMIEGIVQDMGDVEFAFYQDENIVKEAPQNNGEYSLDTSSSYCVDMETGNHISNITWDNETWEVRLKGISKTKTKCYLHFKKIYKEEALNGAIPDLMNGRLVPVVILANESPSDVNYVGGSKGGKVEKADITDTSDPWYSYTNKKWANAVILKDGKVDDYQPGDEIKESDIESYFVWIPRYKYQLKADETTYNTYTAVSAKGTNLTDVNTFYSSIGGNKGSSNVYDIIFETKDKGIFKENQIGKYLTHPAFVAFDTNGLWVGKFETGYNQNSSNDNVMPVAESWSTNGANQNVENSSKVIIKPNVYSWRNINVSNAFYTAYNYQRELESHMMKNSEWGALAYLTQSKYGRCKDNNCDEVRINNSESYITGMSAKNAPTCGYTETKENCNTYETTTLGVDGTSIVNYFNPQSVVSSTTGNYSGIFDMSGSAWEYVMGVMQSADADTSAPASGRSKTYNSNFKGPYSCPTCDSQTEKENSTGKEWPSKKYYDLYDYSTSNQYYNRGILGDATKEFGPFYSVSYQRTKNGVKETGPVRYVSSYNADLAYFVNSGGPWFARGGSRHDGTDAGVFAFDDSYGHAITGVSFRVVLTP